MISYERLVAPAEHLGLLVEPPAAQIHASWPDPAESERTGVAVLDTTIGALRAGLRANLDLASPVIGTGHQAEFTHAGVFAKTIASHALAAQAGGQAIFLLVDTDTPKSDQVALPQVTAAGLRRVYVAIPGCDLRRAFEAQARLPRSAWLQFFASLAALYELRDGTPLDSFARAWLTTADAPLQYCDALVRAQLAVEAELGLTGVRALRVSDLCATPAFRVFVGHVLLEARRFAELYNEAQAAYRRRHHIRAPGRPVPPLLSDGRRTEVPLWVFRADEPRRRLFVAERHADLELTTEDAVVGRLPRADLARAAWSAAPWPTERAGWQIRPRALTLSAFARYFLADFFIHGIGGARYDEMMEDFAGELFGAPPVPAACVSATLHLPLPTSGVRLADIRAARHQSRDVRFNPQRHVAGAARELLARRAELIRRSDELRMRQPANAGERRAVFREIHRVNEELLAADPWRVAQYDQLAATLTAQWEADQLAVDREYFFALHPRAALRELIDVVRRALRPASRQRVG